MGPAYSSACRRCGRVGSTWSCRGCAASQKMDFKKSFQRNYLKLFSPTLKVKSPKKAGDIPLDAGRAGVFSGDGLCEKTTAFFS